MRVTVVTTCTDRKRSGTAEGPRARALPPGDQDQLAANWRAAITSCRETQAARALYCGRSFREAEAAAESIGGDLLVISAGLGLIGADAQIPRYDLTMSRGADDDVSTRCAGAFDHARWWAQVNGETVNPIAQRVAGDPDRVFVVCLSRTYARLVEQDLLSLDARGRERLRLLGPSLAKHVADDLKPCVLPYDARLDAPASPYAGTLSDFASRAARHFTTEVLARLPQAGPRDHAQAVDDALAGWKVPARPSRTSMTDDGIIDVIVASLPDIGRNSARMLRHLRDGRAIACEQRRFSSLYKLAIERASR